MAILRKLIITPVVLAAIYVVIVFVLAFPEPQRFMIFLNRIQVPTRFEMPEWYGFAHHKVRNLDLSLYDKALMDPGHETVIYFHGNAMNRAAPWRVELYKFDRLNIIAIDYRGYGDSEGIPSEEGLQLDAMAVIDWLRDRKVPHHRISLIGHSLGTGVATRLAYEMTRKGIPPKSLIVKAAFSSLPNLIFEYHILDYLPILAPLRALPRIQAWLLESLQHAFDSQSRMEVGTMCDKKSAKKKKKNEQYI
ncbi:Alpha/Beta hydrolase protein [Dichotomocladium elegans]|nr:Alpha/Beta hydrolase protein [Dichotomocladium elegans]